MKKPEHQTLINARVDISLLADQMQNIMLERTTMIAPLAMRYVQAELRRISEEIKSTVTKLEDEK